MSKEEKAKEEKPYLQDLFDHMHNEHGLILLESEMHDIIDICMKQDDYNTLSTQLTAYKEALREIVERLNTIHDSLDNDSRNRKLEVELALTKAKTLIE